MMKVFIESLRLVNVLVCVAYRCKCDLEQQGQEDTPFHSEWGDASQNDTHLFLGGLNSVNISLDMKLNALEGKDVASLINRSSQGKDRPHEKYPLSSAEFAGRGSIVQYISEQTKGNPFLIKKMAEACLFVVHV